MDFIQNPHSNQATGHYSPAVVHDGIAYISGQLPIRYSSEDKLPTGNLLEQARQAFSNLESILRACGSSKELVLKTTIYLSDIEDWDAVNKEYSSFFGSHKPARTVVPTRNLHFDSRIEIDAIAVVKQ